jgi:hypothetical protein
MQYPARTLSNGEVQRPGRVGLNLVTIDVQESNVNPQRMCSPQRVSQPTVELSIGTEFQLRDLGLDGVASDFVEADPVVIAFLNEHCNLHRAVCSPMTMTESSNRN